MAPQFLAACFCLVAASSLPCAAGIASAPGPAGVDVTERRRLKDTAGRCGISGTGVSKAHAATMTTQERLDTYTQQVCQVWAMQAKVGSSVATNLARRRLGACTRSGQGTQSLISNPAKQQQNAAKQKRNDAKNRAIAKIESYVGRGKFRTVVAQNMEIMCGFFMDELHANRPVCDKTFTLQGKKISINCDAKHDGYPDKVGYPAKFRQGSSDLLAVMDLCVSTCMQDRSKTCCQVPAAIASKFACCRENCCCPDNIDDTTCIPKDKKPVSVTGFEHGTFDVKAAGNLRKRRAQAVLGPRKAQVSVAVTVTVEEGSESESVYDALLRCLQNPAKLDSMCLTGSSGH